MAALTTRTGQKGWRKSGENKKQTPAAAVQSCMLIALEEEAAVRSHQSSVLQQFAEQSPDLARGLERVRSGTCAPTLM